MSALIYAYDKALSARLITDDPRQREIIASLQRLSDELSRGRFWFQRFRGAPTKGIYLYGPVGVGKTFLVDLFYKHTPCTLKSRFHFHHFMQQVDSELRRRQGQKDPLIKIAKSLSKSTKLLCLDEFLVDDVAHAMILASFLKALVSQGVVLLITSNTAPDDLYLNGVQRPRFMPAIELIKNHCEVLRVSGQKDYRLDRACAFEAYLYPLNKTSEDKMRAQFEGIASNIVPDKTIRILNREIEVVRYGSDTIWFDFNIICAMPRSQLDYLELAKRFDTVFLSNVKALKEKDTAAAILFIQFIDVLYDCGIRVLISAEVPVSQLYEKGEMKEAFKRTASRLMEMQSEDYLTRHSKREMQHF